MCRRVESDRYNAVQADSQAIRLIPGHQPTRGEVLSVLDTVKHQSSWFKVDLNGEAGWSFVPITFTFFSVDQISQVCFDKQIPYHGNAYTSAPTLGEWKASHRGPISVKGSWEK